MLTGPCGTGKTYIACALGHQACQKGYSVKYYRFPHLILALTQAKADGSYSKLLKTITSLDVLITDVTHSLPKKCIILEWKKKN